MWADGNKFSFGCVELESLVIHQTADAYSHLDLSRVLRRTRWKHKCQGSDNIDCSHGRKKEETSLTSKEKEDLRMGLRGPTREAELESESQVVNQERQRFQERMVGLVDHSKISSKCTTTTKDVMGFNDMEVTDVYRDKGL